MLDKFDPMALGSLLNEEDSGYDSSDPARRSNSNELQHPAEVGREIEPPQSFQQDNTVDACAQREHESTEVLPAHSVHTVLDDEVVLAEHTVERDTSISPRHPSSVRPARVKYPPEEAYFIWYHKIDLGESWDQVLVAFARQFGYIRQKTGLQCKFYRMLSLHGVKHVREQYKPGQDGSDDPPCEFGVVQRTSKRWPWMKPEHQNTPPLPQFWIGPSSPRI